MNPLNADRLLLCLCWAIYLGLVIGGGGLTAILAGWQHGLVVAAAVTFVALVLLSWWGQGGTAEGQPAAEADSVHHHGERGPADQVIQTLVHCLPLFLVATVGITALGGQAFATSGFRTPVAGNGDSTPAGPVAEYTLADVYAASGGAAVAPPPAPVTLTGMAYAPSEEDYARLPGNLTREQAPLLLYRYQITCCAADASPLFVSVLGLDRTRFANDTWLRLNGRLEPPVPPSDVAVLHVTSAEAVAEPAEPYLRRRF